MTESNRLGKYETIEVIGRGGFATVYRARDTKLKRDVALKIFDPILTRDDNWAQMFLHEGRTIARLSDPRIITIYDVDEFEGRTFIAMELIDGPNLAEHLRQKGKLEWDETMRLMGQIAEALDVAHAQGIAHRDLKPANVLLHPQRGAILTDFGFARLVGENTYSMSISGGLVGTPNYMAPEVWEERAPGAPADIYALGCILYELATGEQLFAGEMIPGIMRAHFRGAELPSRWPDGVPDNINNVLHHALAEDPTARYAQSSHMIDALQASIAQPLKKEKQPQIKQPLWLWASGGG